MRGSSCHGWEKRRAWGNGPRMSPGVKRWECPLLFPYLVENSRITTAQRTSVSFCDADRGSRDPGKGNLLKVTQ